MENIKDFICEYIQREYTIPADIDIMSLNYVESGYVDSLGFIQFIATVEDEFGIEFTEDELENSDIKIVGKLVDLITNKMGA